MNNKGRASRSETEPIERLGKLLSGEISKNIYIYVSELKAKIQKKRMRERKIRK